MAINFMTMLHQTAHRVVRKMQVLLGLMTIGVRGIVLNPEKKILLVKHTYQPHWYLPGGGVKKGESALQALYRELQEEVGIEVIDQPVLFGIYYHTYLEVNDFPVIYIVEKYIANKAYSPEIEQMAWFHYEALPEMISPGTKRRLDEYFQNKIIAEKW